MANEFKIRKGYKSLASSEITGSLNISADLTVEGSIYGDLIGTSSYSNTSSYVEYESIASKPTLVSSSVQLAADISGSSTLLSESIASRFTDDEASISSLNAASSSYLKNTTDTLTGDLTVTGTITAQEFHTEFVSASIIYQSGSTKFGDSLDDVHQFTGSVFISGSGTFRNTGPAYFLEGNVGIGTNSPTNRLHVNSGTSNLVAKFESSDSTGYISIKDNTTSTDVHGVGAIGDDLRFFVGGSDAVRFASSGNVGIGTATPTAKLHVDGTDVTAGEPVASFYGPSGSAHFNSSTAALTIQGYDADLNLNITSSGNYANLTEIRFQVDGNTKQRLYSHRVNNHLYLENATTGSTYFNNNGSTRMFISSSGAVGIGTTSTTEKLEVNGAIVWSGALVASQTSAGVLDRSGNDLRIRTYGATAGTGNLVFRTGGGGGSVDSEAMRIDSSGNVGIGTTSPGHLLSIKDGDIAKYTSTGIDTTFDNLIKYGYYANLEAGASYQNRWIGFDSSITAGAAVSNVLRARVYGGGTGNTAPVNVADFRGDQSSIFYGNVGIGTTSPAQALTVIGNTLIQGTQGFNATNETADIYLGDTNSIIRAEYDVGTHIMTNGVERLTVRGSNGRVGIGTTSPTEKLHIVGNVIQVDGSPEYHFGTDSASHYNWRIAAQEVVNKGFEIASGTQSAGTGAASDTYTTRFVIKGDTGNTLIGTAVDYSRLTVSNEDSARTGITISDTNTSSLMLFAGNSSDAVIAIDTYNLAFKTGATVGQDNGTTRMLIQQDGNVGIGSTSPGQKLDVEGNIQANTSIGVDSTGTRAKFLLWGHGSPAYSIGMQNSYTFGGLNNDYAMSFQMNNDSDRGFWWGDEGHSNAQGAMALTTDGRLTVARTARIGYGESDTTQPTTPLEVYGSGSTVLDIQGSLGQLFSVDDDLTGTLFAVSDISGVPILAVEDTGEVTVDDTLIVNDKVGIGTTDSSYAKLTVLGTNHQAIAVTRNGSTTPALFLGNDGGSIARIAGNNADLQLGRDLSNSFDPYLVIKNGTGNIGIGTTSPTEKLDVRGNLQVIAQGDTTGIILNTTNASYASRFRYRTGGTDYWSFDARGSGEGYDFKFYRYNGGWDPVMTFDWANGYVGIQTESPGVALDVAGAISATENITAGSTSKASDTVIRALAGDSYKTGFEAYGSNQGTGYIYVGQSSAYGGGMSYNGDGSPSFVSGETADYITFFNRSAGTNTEVFSYPYSGTTVYFNGDVVAYASSDRELKDNLKPIDNSLEMLKKISGYEFDWNEDKQDTYEGHDIGVVAQEIEEILPDLVVTRDNGYKAVKYEKLVALLIQSNKELLARVEELEARIK